MTGHSRKRAFSLIEAAIVLGVVGLVIGGIWISAASIRAKIRANNVVYMVNQTIEVYQKYAKETPSQDIIHLMNGTLLPPGFTYTPNVWGNTDIIHGNGVILYGFYNWYDTEDGLYGDISFSESYENFQEVPQPETCLALYKYFVAQSWSPIITPGLSISGHNFNPNVDNDMSSVATACKTSKSFSFYGLYP